MSKSFRFYVAALAIIAGVCLLVADWTIPAADVERHWNAVAAFLVLGFASEASYVNLRVGKAETGSSVAFIPFIASVILFSEGWAALVAGCAMLAVDFVVRRKAPARVLFNVSQIVVSVYVTSRIYGVLGGQPSLTSFDPYPVATAAAVGSYFFVNSTAVSLAVATWHRENVGRAWVRIAGWSLVYDLVTSLLAPLLAYLFVRWEIPGILFLVLPIYFVRHLYYVSLQLEQVNRDLLELMVKAIEARDPYTSGHSQRVSEIAGLVARDIGLGHRAVEQIRTAALLHDVGKIYEDFAPLLRKESRLDATERALMQTHPTRSAELVATISGFRGVIENAVRYHHENFDGSGYPLGLSGRAIPVGARIIMIADTIDAMTTDRPYRRALSFDRVIEELRRHSGRQFDPSLVDRVVSSAAIRTLVEGRVPEHKDLHELASLSRSGSYGNEQTGGPAILHARNGMVRPWIEKLVGYGRRSSGASSAATAPSQAPR
jgi:putative nucleotidyltransferase with HDIG domain